MKDDAPRVIKIPAKPETTRQAEARRQLRVAAYCRVSTKEEDQANSYEVQKEYYTDKIMSNTAWTMAGIFADKGITGTSAKKREDFMRMIRHCRQKKIDVILTKSVSRFSRNTVDCLYYIRALKQLGIAVIFEKENINSLEEDSELRITLSGAFAQSESESISANVTWGKRRAMEAGKVSIQYKKLYGYRKGEDGQPEIIPEQAEIVKRIFREYLEGKSCKKIAQGLERDGILTSRGKSQWHDTTIRKILENEKYMGDVLLQKTCTVDFLNKKRVKNTGMQPQYYVEDDHEAIIPKDIFLRVQEEMARRSTENSRKRRFSSNHAFSQIVFCSECEEIYKRLHWNNRGSKYIVWRCSSHLHEKKTCNSRTVREDVLQDAFLEAVNQIVGNSREYLKILQQNLELAINAANPASVEYLDARMEDLQRELIDRTESGTNYDDLAEEILRLRQLREQTVMDDVSKAEYQSRIKELQAFIQSQPKRLTFDDTLVKHLLAKITIFPVI